MSAIDPAISDPANVGLFEALYSTRALRRFKPDPVPDEVLFQVLDAGIRAPAGSNRQDQWHFLIVRDPEKRRQIGEWYWETWAEYGRQYVEDPSRIDALPWQMRLVVRSTDDLARHVAEVPVHLFACGAEGSGSAVYPAIQNILLACRGLGLGSVITGFHRSHERELNEMLAIPQGKSALALLPIGWPRDRIGPVNRIPLRKVTSFERWGEGWEYAERQPAEGLRDRWVRPS